MNTPRLHRILVALLLVCLLSLNMAPALASAPAVGAKIKLGHYFQESGWDEAIVWRVLDVKPGKALLLADRLLDSHAFNSTGGKTSWKDCTLRYWLNHDFLDQAFTDEEQAVILTTNVLSGKGDVTEDQLFLLSKDEVLQYFADGKPTRRGYPTEYAANTGTWVGADGVGWWWLRDMAAKKKAMWVNVEGGIQTGGTEVYNPGCIRPAFWMATD